MLAGPEGAGKTGSRRGGSRRNTAARLRLNQGRKGRIQRKPEAEDEAEMAREAKFAEDRGGEGHPEEARKKWRVQASPARPARAAAVPSRHGLLRRQIGTCSVPF